MAGGGTETIADGIVKNRLLNGVMRYRPFPLVVNIQEEWLI
jgi:hypothetical protein